MDLMQIVGTLAVLAIIALSLIAVRDVLFGAKQARARKNDSRQGSASTRQRQKRFTG